MSALVWKLLRQHISIGQLAGFSQEKAIHSQPKTSPT